MSKISLVCVSRFVSILSSLVSKKTLELEIGTLVAVELYDLLVLDFSLADFD